ncbi:MAG: hypothetical protein JW789_00255 [Candidatus Aenigmarchaeota archaeon]|nr:hypothetical protein [Candidatus Aenigmarchaeota archaeon]
MSKNLTIGENSRGDVVLIMDMHDGNSMRSWRSYIPGDFPGDMIDDDVSYSIVHDMLEKGYYDIEMPTGPFSVISQFRKCRRSAELGHPDLLDPKFYTYLPLSHDRMENALMTVYDYFSVRV